MESILQQRGNDLDLVFLDEQQETDFSYWEFINQSDADSDTESLLSLENGFVSWFTSKPPPSLQSPNTHQEIETHELIQGEDLVNEDASSRDYHVNNCFGYYQPEARFIVDDDEEEGDGSDDDEEEEDDGYGLDDELVPWNVSGKLGRQRMRKLGKRAFARMGNSKRNPYLHVKPGAVRGKHGLGIKA